MNRVLPTATMVLVWVSWPLLLGAQMAQQAVNDPLRQAATAAVGDNDAEAALAIQALRDAGQSGLDTLLNAHPERFGPVQGAKISPDRSARVRAAVDAVAMQKDATASRLYWYTDLKLAQAAAAQAGKPILTLRLLGKLNEDLSCANSRFFRTALYPNREINTYLREHFILHWQSVRPVPVVTIDMGDGRKIVRTITGNSIHYVLDSHGRVVDGLPGLYGPAAFLRDLKVAEMQARLLTLLDDAAFVSAEQTWAAQRAQAIREAFAADVAIAKVTPPLDDQGWAKIAGLHLLDARLDGPTIELIRSKGTALDIAPGAVPAAVAMPIAVSKSRVELPIMRMVRNLEGTIGIDTVKSEYDLHQQLYQWLAASPKVPDLAALNDRVYSQLFKTPPSDPWIGLAPPDVFSGIDHGGAVPPTPQPSR